MADEAIPVKTILHNGLVAGSVLSYEQYGDREVSYWLGSEFWGKGIATRGLSLYLKDVDQRPIYARAAKRQSRLYPGAGEVWLYSLRSGDRICHARGEEIEEVVMMLE